MKPILAATFQLLLNTLVSTVYAGSSEVICTFEDNACSLTLDDSLGDTWEVTQGTDSSDNTLNLSERRTCFVSAGLQSQRGRTLVGQTVILLLGTIGILQFLRLFFFYGEAC